jgi:D-alanine-D-alanine ligase
MNSTPFSKKQPVPPILLVHGGGGTEHEISKISVGYLSKCLRELTDQITEAEMQADGSLVEINTRALITLEWPGKFKLADQTISNPIVVPCIHGPPGETGQFQSMLELLGLKYLGNTSEPSQVCFNKATSKLWFDSLGIPNTPYIILSGHDASELSRAEEFLTRHQGQGFLKAASQGSSVGCYPIKSLGDLRKHLPQAFQYSPYVILEKTVKGRELEVSAFEYQGKLHLTLPGEIVPPDSFYSYEEKYSAVSKTETIIQAANVPPKIVEKIHQSCDRAFRCLRLRHLARIDFFYVPETETVYLNEINTFPGMTPISMFPKMMENYGINFKLWLEDTIQQIIKH